MHRAAALIQSVPTFPRYKRTFQTKQLDFTRRTLRGQLFRICQTCAKRERCHALLASYTAQTCRTRPSDSLEAPAKYSGTQRVHRRVYSSMRVGVAASVKRSCADELLCICRWYTGHFDGFAIAAFKRGRTRDVLYGEFSRPRIINDKSCGSQQCCCANWVRL